MFAPIFTSLALFATGSLAFWGQVNIELQCAGSEGNPCFNVITLKDYNTGSTYVSQGFAWPPHDGIWHNNYWAETSPGGYNFNGRFQWTQNCIHIDFQGALGSGSGYCCNGLPCDLCLKGA